MLYDYLKSLKSGTNDETNGRHIVAREAAKACVSIANPRILDVGAGYGRDLMATGELLGRSHELYAIEAFPQAVEFLRSRQIDVQSVNLERERLPFEDGFFDVVICNQVLEHLKEIFWTTSELSRVTKVGGKLVIGVPNLGSLHNRLSLMFGRQPPAMRVFGPHVRGYTASGMTDFLERGGFLKVSKIFGGNFYPLPPSTSRLMSNYFPSLSVSSFYVVERVKDGNFLSILSTPQAMELVDTPYFRGQ
jgi:SAM-dependent methyltransferase